MIKERKIVFNSYMARNMSPKKGFVGQTEFYPLEIMV